MQLILNLTQHLPTVSQVEAGVVEPEAKEKILSYLTFQGIPTKKGMESRAEKLAEYAVGSGFKKAMIGGLPCFMPILEKTLLEKGIIVCYAFSARKSVEQHNEDGSVTKMQVFEHQGFYEVM